MAETINLTQVEFAELNQDINLIVEDDTELRRLSIADIGSEILIDLSSSVNSNANPVNADTLSGYSADYFASQGNLDEAIENIDSVIADKVSEAVGNIDIDVGPKIELNYSIVGGLEEPAEPTENMIWIQTDEEISKIIFKGIEPKNEHDSNYSIVCFF